MKNPFILLLTAFLALAGCAGGGGSYTSARIQQDFAVGLDVPDSAWEVEITGIYDTGSEIIMVAELERPEGVMAAQAITWVSDRVTLTAPYRPVQTYVVGKTWNWVNDAPYEFIDSRAAIAGELDDATRLWPR